LLEISAISFDDVWWFPSLSRQGHFSCFLSSKCLWLWFYDVQSDRLPLDGFRQNCRLKALRAGSLWLPVSVHPWQLGGSETQIFILMLENVPRIRNATLS
jgi:hypothetical protein